MINARDAFKIASTALIALGMATSAHALEMVRDANGKAVCLPAAEVMAQLKAEGQEVIAVGDRAAFDGTAPSQLFTARADGTLGNILEGNGSLTQKRKSTCFAVRNKLTNIRLNDPASAEIPTFALVRVNPDVAKTALAQDKFGRAAIHNDSVATGYRNGFRVLLTATAYQLDGKTPGPMITFGFNPTDPDKLGAVMMTRATGVTNGITDTVSTTLTTAFFDQLKRPTQVASNDGASGSTTAMRSMSPLP
ncbi:MAG: hypothetical protein DDT26_02341 [Dehalococcoidia bacterium]|nr:hypothetical protein [Chloroflexota bacterium]